LFFIASGDLSFDEFCRILLPVFTGKFQDDELLFVFKKFDLNGTGYISVNELKQVLANVGQNFSEKEIANMIAKVDKDNDGRLNFEGKKIQIFNQQK
jgi:Ca2+-binding EF-hand superfamily protein